MAKDKSVPLGIGLLGGNAKVYNTIAEMQKDSKLKAGKVVEVLGYYQAGDGAGHKRVIADSDDGSGVLLENRLYANIVHNGEVKITWLGITENTLADNNKTIINKAISSIQNLNKLILDTSLKCYEIEISKDVVISGVSKNKEDIFIRNENETKNTFVFKNISGEKTYFSNFREVGGLNGVFSDYVDFNPKFENVSFTYCKQAGINHTPNETFNQNGYSNSFLYSYIKNIDLKYNKYGLLLDHSKVPLRQNWSNANNIEYSKISSNEIGIYIKKMDRMECWQINNSDLSWNSIGDNREITLEQYKQKLINNKYGAIILEDCTGCDIELNSTYTEFSGDLNIIGVGTDLENEIKSNGSEIYSNTYEYQDVIMLDVKGANNAIISKNREYAMFNLINCNSTRISVSNCWLEYCNDIIQSIGGNKNSFITKGLNNMESAYTYIDKVRGIFNLDNNFSLLDISKETLISKNPDNTSYVPPYYLPSFCQVGWAKLSNVVSNVTESNIDISSFNNSTKLSHFLSGVSGNLSIFGQAEVFNNTSGSVCDNAGNTFIIGKDKQTTILIFDTEKGNMELTSRIGNFVIRGVTLKFKGSGDIVLSFNNIEYADCIFDFSEFTGTLKLYGNKQVFSRACSYVGENFSVIATCILENLGASDFFWNDFRTTIPEKITSYPQGHGFNLNGVDYVRKGSQWVKASDGTTQALSEVMTLDTSYYSRLMEQEGIINDYDSYRLALSEYNKQEEIEFEHSMKVYNDYLTTVTDKDNIMTYEEFEQTYGNTSMMNRRKKRSLVERLEEPTIPESVAKFMEKYLGTTPTPKVETKPRTFSFDEVDKLNDTLKKL